MKILPTALLFISQLAFSQRIPIDKQKHFAVGGIVSEFSYVRPGKHPFWNSVLAATAAGIAKESYDYSQGFKFDTGDVAFTIAGGTLVGGIMYIVTKKKNKKVKKHER